MKDQIQSKEPALKFARILLQSVRDAVFFQNNGELIHKDYLPIIEKMGQVPAQKLHQSMAAAQQFERDIYGNVERSLAYHHFIQQLEFNMNYAMTSM